MATDLTRISEKARREPKLVFTSLYHHIYDVDNLRACYDTLKAKKAIGVDGVTKAQYGENLEENLQGLSARLKRMGYRPGPKRRSYIPKSGSAKGRPLGISNFEDKIVELATRSSRQGYDPAGAGRRKPDQVLSCQLSGFGHVVMPQLVYGNGASSARCIRPYGQRETSGQSSGRAEQVWEPEDKRMIAASRSSTLREAACRDFSTGRISWS